MKKTLDSGHALIDFLTEFATVLIQSGATCPQLVEAAEIAFVRAASAKARLRNSRVNQSAVAAMTGLTRSQVRAITKNARANPKDAKSRPAQVVLGWTSDPLFLTASGNPRSLAIRKGKVSFRTLAETYGADVPHKALLSELTRLGIVKVSKERVRLVRPSSGDDVSRNLQILCSALAQTISALASVNGTDKVRASVAELQFPALPSVGKVLLRRRVRQSLDAFVMDLKSAAYAARGRARASRTRDLPMSKMNVLVVTRE